jgi:hypothetical protein
MAASANGRCSISAIAGILLALLVTLTVGSSVNTDAAAGAGTPTGKEISVYENSESAAFIGEVLRVNCKVKGRTGRKRFHAGGHTVGNAYTLDITILDFKGFSKTYNVPYGSLAVRVDFEGVSNPSDFSNVFPFPGGQPPGGAGQIAFSRKGGRVGLGVYALPNQDYSRGIALAGSAKCIYPS